MYPNLYLFRPSFLDSAWERTARGSCLSSVIPRGRSLAQAVPRQEPGHQKAKQVRKPVPRGGKNPAPGVTYLPSAGMIRERSLAGGTVPGNHLVAPLKRTALNPGADR